MRKAIVTITVGDRYEQMAAVSHPTIKAYADKVEADFIVWRDFKPHTIPAYQKLEIGKLLEEYDRVLYVDTDILIRGDAPDLFDLVPVDTFAAFNEFIFTARAPAMAQFINDPGWIASKKYFNTGVFMCSSEHKGIFKPAIPEINNFYEQTYLNYMIYSEKIKTTDIHHKWNRMSCMDLITGEQRYDSYFLHYAGCALETPLLIRMMQTDLIIWERSQDKVFPRNIFINAHGGLGDVVASEPVIRYARKHMWPEANMIIQTHNPEVFEHLEGVRTHEPNVPIENIGFYFRNLIAQDDEDLSTRMIHALCHPTNYAAVTLLKGEIEPDQRQPMLSTKGHTLDMVSEVAFANSVLLHPGKGWESKTFPKSWWDMVIAGIRASGVAVALIGKSLNESQGFVDVETEGTNCFFDKLSLKNMFRAIELSPVLVSNDSSPVHIAGAFDNYIGLIATCKDAFRILPYRRGRQDYKATDLGRGIIERIKDPAHPYVTKIDYASQAELASILPDPSVVVEWAVSKFHESKSPKTKLQLVNE